MSVRVRLTRVGSKKNPIWRVVVADQRSPRDGRFIETIGRYNPQTEPSTIAIDEERLQHWLARGAQPTGAVKQLMKAQTKAGGPSVPETAAEPAATDAEPAAAATESAAAAPEPSEAAEAAPVPAEAAEAAPEPAEAAPEAADREAAPESAEAAPESADAAPEPASAAPDPAPAAPDEVAEGRPEPPAADS
jgi:small subunit ribosomal protein S16